MFIKNNARFKALFAGLVLLVMAGSLFISCPDGNNTETVDAQQPSITGQPIGGNWNVTTNDTFHLAVTASVTDGGALSYQWYKNTTNSASGGQTIGTDHRTIDLNKDDYTDGEDCYFYVVVTNTISDNGDGGTKTATAASSVVKVEVRTTGVTEGNPEEEEEWEWDLPAGLSGYFQTEYDNLMYYSYDTDISGYTVDGFFIDPASKKFDYYFDTSLEYGWGGTIVNHVPGADNSEVSVLIVAVSWAKKNLASQWADYISLPDTGKYFAYSYKNLAISGGDTMISSAAPYGDNMTGTATIQEAITEYTAENEYYGTFGLYIGRAVTPAGLENLKGNWVTDFAAEGDYFVLIRGTGYTEFADDEDEINGIYDDPDWDMSAAIGIIVDYTDPTKASGVLYIQVIESEFGFTAKKYIAVAWKNKNGDSIDMMLGTEEESTLTAVKAAYPNASSTYFAENGFNSYER
jgi:hypothetical protein